MRSSNARMSFGRAAEPPLPQLLAGLDLQRDDAAVVGRHVHAIGGERGRRVSRRPEVAAPDEVPSVARKASTSPIAVAATSQPLSQTGGDGELLGEGQLPRDRPSPACSAVERVRLDEEEQPVAGGRRHLRARRDEPRAARR